MAAPMPGVMEIVMVLSMFFGSGMGIPVGMPPGPEDPLMARVAPEQCLFYSTWSPRAAADPNSDNSIDKLLSEPEMQRTFAIVEREIRRGLARAQRDANAEETFVATAIPKVAELLLTQSGAMYVQELRMEGDTVRVNAGAIVGLGEREAEIGRLLAQLRQTMLDGQTTSVQINGSRFDRIQMHPDAPPLEWGIANGYFIVGVGEGAAEKLMANGKTDPPAWLTASREKLSLQRRASFAYADLQQLKNLIPPAAGFQAQMVLDFAGLTNVTHYATATGLNERGVVSKTLLALDGEATGLLRVVDAEPLTRDDFQGIPQDAIVASVFRLDLGQVYQNTMQSLVRIQPQMVGEVQREIRNMENNLGFRLEQDVFDALGSVWRLHAARSNGGFFTGWTVSVDLRDAQKLQRVGDRLTGLVAGMFGNRPDAPRIRHLDVHGATVHYLSVPENEFLVAPAWCITEDELVLGLFPQTISGYLADREAPSLAESPALASAFDGDGPVAVSYLDTRYVFETLYPLLYFGGRAAIVELQREEAIDVDITVLPSVTSISKHLHPTVGWVSRTEDGVMMVREQSVPGGSVGATAPVTIALLLPAVQAAREAARRMESMNNLKQMALAMHNYHDTYKGFPARYNTDEEGKPLLSWRVHILPFVEAGPLYDQFRFDEPWDSEHNKQLISQMPMVYRSPNSSLPRDAGKTNYLGIKSDESVFQPPPESKNGVPHPTAIGLRDILDGTSNTIMMVEVPDEHAIVWTKPDDLELDANDPLSKLRGHRPGGFLASLCDGSVRFISETVDLQTFRALITRAGGEVINQNF